MFAVAIGGFFGAILRFTVSQFIHVKLHKEKFFATGFINAIGSFLLGLFLSMEHSDFAMQFIGIGFLGAFTTFSTFSFEVVQLLEHNRMRTALSYVLASIILSIIFATFGYMI